MHRILIADKLPPEGLQVLQASDQIELDMRAGLQGEELAQALAEADGVVIRSGTTLTAELLEKAEKLKVIVRAGVGVDNIDLPAATRHGKVVMNTPGGNTLSTAEQTMALLLCLARNTAAADASMKAGKWDRAKYAGTQLAGKTIGIVGLGRVGQGVAGIARGIGMKVVGYDPFMPAAKASELGIEKIDDLAELYPQSDVLTVHVPNTPETAGMVGAEQLAALPEGAFVVNCARGGIVDEDALVAALKGGRLGGAGLDVYASEPPPQDSPLRSLENVVLTPHLGASTKEAQLNVAIEAAELIVDYLVHGNVRYGVNVASLDGRELAEVGRYLEIAWRLGLLQGQLLDGSVTRAVIEYRGDAARKQTSLMTAGFTMGLLARAFAEDVNMVSAKMIAEERGIEIVETVSSEPTDFATLIRTEVVTDKGSFVASGTTRGEKYIRLVRLGEHRLDTFLEGGLLVYDHTDRPGLIGFIGSTLGDHGVNIGQMTVGRSQPGGPAVGLLSVDSEPSADALARIAAHEHVQRVKYIDLPAFGVGPL